MSNWSEKTLDELGTVGRGKSKHRPRDAAFLYGGPYPFIQTADVKNANFYINSFSQTYSEEGLKQSKLWTKGTLCITIAANIADTGILDIEACFPDSIIGFIANEEICNVKYIKYYIGSFQKNLKQISQGAAQDNLNLQKLLAFKFKIPDKNTQDKVVNILSAYDDLIENNLKRIALLEEAAESIYKEWFVNFRFPGYEKCEVVNSIPDKWKVGKVSDIAVLDSGYAFKSKDFQEQGNPIIKIKNIENNSINTMDCDCVEKSIVEKLSKFKLECGDLLIAMTGATVGKIGIMPRTQKDYYLNQRVGRIKSKYDFDISSYIFCLFNSNFISNSIINIAKGAAQPNISTVEIGNIEILLPEQNVLYDFEKCCSYLLKSRLNLIEQNEKLKESRDILISKLIMGEIEV